MKTIKSKLPETLAKSKFIEFLTNHSLYDKYFREFVWSYHSPHTSKPLEEYWSEWAGLCSQYNWIDGIIVFHKSRYGEAFWNDINTQWYRELDILNEEYTKSLGGGIK